MLTSRHNTHKSLPLLLKVLDILHYNFDFDRHGISPGLIFISKFTAEGTGNRGLTEYTDHIVQINTFEYIHFFRCSLG